MPGISSVAAENFSTDADAAEFCLDKAFDFGRDFADRKFFFLFLLRFGGGAETGAESCIKSNKLSILYPYFQPIRVSANSSALNLSKSSMLSPTPMK